MEVGPDRPRTAAGMVRAVVVPSPSCPPKFAPQHSAPDVVLAQVWLAPVAMAVTTPPSPATSTGAQRWVVEPSPSWPDELSPQHFTLPSAISAQVCETPADTATTPADRPVTSTGVMRVVLVPSP